MPEQALYPNAVPQAQEQLTTGWATAVTVRDGRCPPLGYTKYTMTSDAAKTIADVLTANAMTLPTGARTVSLYFENNPVRLLMSSDNGTPSQTVGTPHAAGVFFPYSPPDLTKITWANQNAGSNATVHIEFLG